MKTTTMMMIILTALALIFSLSAWTGNQLESAEPGVITVTGEAEVRVVPDEVVLTLGVETWDEDLKYAKSQNDERVKAILAIAQGYGVEPRYIQTDHISIEPRYEDNYEKDGLIGYFVRKTIVITLKDIAKFDDLLTSVIEADLNYVHGIEFRTTELRKYRDEARALAIKAAREKASALAGELGQSIGKPRTIQEEQAGWWSWYNYWWGSRWSGGMSQNVVQEVNSNASVAEGTFAPGQISVNARVNVTFELN
ncbi:MAG: SIMPL domain-containing protein [Chloroflexi bacterium]|nr:SIMPL domain-containing protein [Chloroflexota bacterium]